MAKTCRHCGQEIALGAPAGGFLGLHFAEDGTVLRNGREIRTSPQRRAILRLLHRAKGELVSYDRIYEHLYFARPDCDWPDGQSIRPQLSYLRRELHPFGVTVECRHGYGYRLRAINDQP